MDNTPRLLLNKPNPDPVTGDFVDVSKLNENADKIDAAISATVCTSGTRPTSPFQGQIILEVDTGRMYVRLDTSWLQLAVQTATFNNDLNLTRQIQIERSNVLDHVLRTLVTPDVVHRFLVMADGKVEWGPGGLGGRDTNLYRRTANLLGTDDSFQADGFCAGNAVESVRTSFVNFTSEAVIQSVTFDGVSGVTYMIDATQHYQSSVAGDIIRTRLRWASGGSVTTSGTTILILNPNCDVAAKGNIVNLRKKFVAPSTGQFTVGVTMERVGTGTGQAYGDVNQAYNTISVVGA